MKMIMIWVAITLTILALVGLALADSREAADGAGEEPTESTAEKAPSAETRYSKLGYDITPLPRAAVNKLTLTLTPEQFRVTQSSGTEAAFCGGLLDNKEAGIYACVVCGLPLFRSEGKFESGTGWPSFDRAFSDEHVARIEDRSHGMVRVETRCVRCDAHLGHVFEDGPQPTGLRHCLNSAALTFHADGTELPPEARPAERRVAHFAGGCFWGMEALFENAPGVIDAESGYMGGSVANPTSEQVGTRTTGHAETVRVTFDPARTSYRKLLHLFFANHEPTLDPTAHGRADYYRPVIFCVDEEQKQQADTHIAGLTESNAYEKPIVTQAVLGAGPFWKAEERHQDYYRKRDAAAAAAGANDSDNKSAN